MGAFRRTSLGSFLYGRYQNEGMRGQVSVEYLVLVGVAIGVLVPAVLFFYKYSQTTEASSSATQINEVGLQMVSVVKSTYALGRNARQTLEFTMPENVNRVYVDNMELVFVYETAFGESEAVFFSKNVPMTSDPSFIAGNISIVHPGLTKYQFESLGSEVNITEVIT